MNSTRIVIAAAAFCSLLTSCFKEEALNAEADILKASVPASEDLFYRSSDATRDVFYNADEIVFTVKKGAVVGKRAPEFVITDGATVSPASGTELDFSDGAAQTYVVTSQDKQWNRTYTLKFVEETNPRYFSLDTHTMYVNKAGKEKFAMWDGLCTANEGFMTARGSAPASAYPSTVEDIGYKGACVKLRTVSTGIFGATTGKPIAAGNLFLGAFDMEYAMTETLKATKFGVPVTKKPVSYTGWYKYEPGPQMKNGKGELIPGVDEGAIYAILYKNHDENGNEVMITGEDPMTNPYRVGMAMLQNVVSTNGEWVKFNLVFNYWEDVDMELLANGGYNLAMVFSASKEGDLFKGAEGSTLLVDEIEIVYEE